MPYTCIYTVSLPQLLSPHACLLSTSSWTLLPVAWPGISNLVNCAAVFSSAAEITRACRLGESVCRCSPKKKRSVAARFAAPHQTAHVGACIRNAGWILNTRKGHLLCGDLSGPPGGRFGRETGAGRWWVCGRLGDPEMSRTLWSIEIIRLEGRRRFNWISSFSVGGWSCPVSVF